MKEYQILNIEQMLDNLSPKKRLLALDVGTKTIGIAISDSKKLISTPIETIYRKNIAHDSKRIKLLIADRNVGGFIVGLPINMNGSEGPRCQSVRQFIKNIQPFFNIPFVFWDERLSTQAAQKSMIDQDISRLKQKKRINHEAASIILQGLLDLAQNKKMFPKLLAELHQ